MASIKRHFLWSAVEQVGPRLIQILVMIGMARLLEPAAFGLMGMLALFMGIAQVFSDCGLSASLIQRKSLTPDDETSVWVMNLIFGASLAVLMSLTAPWVAEFYKQPVLSPMLRVLSLSIVFASFGIVQSALLSRALQFQQIAMVSAASTMAAGVTGLVMALLGCGVWSLVGSVVAASLVRSSMLWFVSDWRPQGRLHWHCVRSMWSFSSYLLYSHMVGIAYQNLYPAIIGRVYSAESLGFYDRANNLRMLPSGVLAGMVQRVAFPLFSRCQDDTAQLLQRIREIVRGTIMLSAFGLALMAVLADPLIPMLLSEKWRPSIPLFRILCYAGALYPIHALYLLALQAQGHSKLNLRIECVKVAIGVGAVYSVYRLGVTALAWAVVGVTAVSYFINAYYNVGLLGYRWSMQARDILPTLVLCVVAGVGGGLAGAWVPPSFLLVLAVRAGVFAAISGAGLYVFRETYFADASKHLQWVMQRARQKISGFSACAA